jgi:hypothetical protein
MRQHLMSIHGIVDSVCCVFVQIRHAPVAPFVAARSHRRVRTRGRNASHFEYGGIGRYAIKRDKRCLELCVTVNVPALLCDLKSDMRRRNRAINFEQCALTPVVGPEVFIGVRSSAWRWLLVYAVAMLSSEALRFGFACSACLLIRVYSVHMHPLNKFALMSHQNPAMF